MYQFTFGQYDEWRAYIFEMDGEFFADDPYGGSEKVVTSGTPVTFHYDPVGGDLLPTIIKTSVTVQLKRTKDGQFQKIFESAENRWKLIILKNGRLTPYARSSYPEGKATPWATGDIAFLGTLTRQTFSEQYIPVPTVSLTFHDRLGELDEIHYSGGRDIQPLTQVVAELLQGTSLGGGMEFQLPYQLQDETDISPDRLLIDTRGFAGQKRLKVLQTILRDLGLQLFASFKKYNSSYNFKYLMWGSAHIRYVGDVSNIVNRTFKYNVFHSDVGTTVHSQTEGVDVKEVKLLTFDTPMQRGANVEVLHRASRIVARNDLKTHGLTPEFLASLDTPRAGEDSAYLNLDDSTVITREWGYGDPLDFASLNKVGMVRVNRVGAERKPSISTLTDSGVSLRLCSTRFFGVVGEVGYVVSGEVWCRPDVFNARFWLRIVAYDTGSGDAYVWDGSGWVVPPDYHSISVGGDVGYYDWSVDITPPPFPQGTVFYMSVGIEKALGAGLETQLTAFDVSLKEPEAGLPPFLQVVTNINSENRGDVELKNELMTLPDVGGSIFWAGGIFYKMDDGGVRVLHSVMVDGDVGTLLVHNSEMHGVQYAGERVRLNGKLFVHEEKKPPTIIIAEWTEFRCEIVLSPMPSCSGRGRATELIMINSTLGFAYRYSLLDAFGSEPATNLMVLMLAGEVLYSARCEALLTHLTGIYGYDVRSKVNNEPIKDVMFSCIPEVTKIFVKLDITSAPASNFMGETDGLTGAVQVLVGGLVVETIHIPYDGHSRPKTYEKTVALEPGTYRFSFVFLSYTAGGVADGYPYRRWRIDGGAYTISGETTDISSSCTVEVRIGKKA